MPASLFRYFIVLLLSAAAPAQAMVCKAYDAPLTQEQVESYADDARDGYPAKYRALLDSVKITLTDSADHNLAMVSGSQGSELLVPRGYLKVNCILSMGAGMYDDYAQEQVAKGKPADFPLPDCPGLRPRACLMLKLEEGLSRTDGSESERRLAETFRMMIESGFKFAIAHEFGHVIADAERDAGHVRLPADYDAELAADLLAMHTIASSQVFALADTFLFGGQVLIDAVDDGDAANAGPHEATICRARRSTAMRDRLVPSLLQVLTWLHTGDAVGQALPRLAKEFTPRILFAPTSATCDAKLPAEVGAIERDLRRIAAVVTPLPAPVELDAAQIAAIRDLHVRSRIGRAMRNAIYGTVSVLRIARLGGVLSGRSVEPAERQRLMAELDRIDREPSLTDMASRDYRDFLYVRAIGRFVSAPPGASFTAQAADLRSAIDRANAYGQPHMVMGLFDATSLFYVGDCNGGMARLLATVDLREALLARAQHALQSAGIAVEELPAVYRPMIDYGQGLRARGEPIPQDVCRQMAGAMASQVRATYGWGE